MRTRRFLIVLALALSMSIVMCVDGMAYTQGTYSAQGQGNNGPVQVEVSFDEDLIVSVVVTDHGETPGISDPAISQIPDAIVSQQSLLVDTVSSATNTSRAILDAVEDCVVQAGGDPQILKIASDFDAELVAGIYYASARGFTGYVDVYVTVDENSIVKVDVASCTDVPQNISRVAIEQMPKRIVDAQSTRVDVVTGATFTSNAIKTATAQALEQAGNAARFAVEPTRDEVSQGDDETVDILILGGGGSGCMAALTSQNPDLTGEDSGLSVMLVEKQAYLGGSTMMSGGFIGAAMPLDDDTNLNDPDMMQAYLDGQQNRMPNPVNMALMEKIARVSGSTVLNMQKLGMPMVTASSTLDPDEYNDLIGWGLLSHLPGDPGPDGWAQAGDEIGTFFERRLAMTPVDVRLNTTADSLIVEDGQIVGAVVHDQNAIYNVYAKKVIVACGSYAGSSQLIAQYHPEAAGCPLYANGGNTGDGLRMIQEAVGVEPLVGRLMDGYFGLEARYAIDNDLRAAFFEGANSIFLINKEGKRFTYDGAGYNIHQMHDAIVAQSGKVGYVIANASHPGAADIEKSVLQEYIVRSDTLEGIAEQLDIDPQALNDTVQSYSQARLGQGEDAFGTDPSIMLSMEEEPYYAFPMYSVITATFSGMNVDDNCLVLDADGQPVENLYAVGETAYGAASVANALFSGVIAGNHARENVLAQ
ncbi:MAG: FAD-dependent oxidoreductase [Clostridia bacterium]|nr:FAD-dependent oxidoreductase [Clostridia bacterium]